MMKTKSCTIRLLNKTFEIKCQESEKDDLLLAAQKLDSQMLHQKAKFKHLDNFQTLLMAALHVSHEFIKCQKEQDKQRVKVNQLINTLEDKINKAVACEDEI